ncbi:MAG: hypothetical protein NTU93_09515 [Arthrobacter sp.]|nr:hypothetical protein [Arthrobacter sp.]
MNRRVTALAASAFVGIVMLTACAGPPSAADRSYRGMLSNPPVSLGAPKSAQPSAPPGASPAPRLTLGTPTAGWVDKPRRFGVPLWGSSSCPAIPTRIEATAPDRVTIRFEASAQNPCTADLAPTTHEFSVPAGAGTLPLTITLIYAEGEGTTTLVLE